MTPAPRARDLVARADLLLKLRRPADAEREARRALAEAPDDMGGHLALALALSRQGDTGGALDAANAAAALNPGSWVVHWVAGDVLGHADRHREALAAFQNALACDAERPPVYEALSRAHYLLGEWAPAVQAADEGLRRAPEDPALTELMAHALVKVHDVAGAREHAARAVRLAPDSATAHRTRGLVALRTGDPRAAEDAFREALRIAPERGGTADLLLEALSHRIPLYRLDSAVWRVRLLPRRRMVWWILASVFAPWFVFMLLVTWAIWLNGVLRAGTSVRLGRDPFVRRLLPGPELRAARIAVGALATGAALVALSAALWTPALLLPGLAFIGLVTPVQEAGRYEGPFHTGLLVFAGALGAFAAVLAPLAYAAPRLEWVPVAALLTFYAAMGSVWPAMLIPNRPR